MVESHDPPMWKTMLVHRSIPNCWSWIGSFLVNGWFWFSDPRHGRLDQSGNPSESQIIYLAWSHLDLDQLQPCVPFSRSLLVRLKLKLHQRDRTSAASYVFPTDLGDLLTSDFQGRRFSVYVDKPRCRDKETDLQNNWFSIRTLWRAGSFESWCTGDLSTLEVRWGEVKIVIIISIKPAEMSLQIEKWCLALAANSTRTVVHTNPESQISLTRRKCRRFLSSEAGLIPINQTPPLHNVPSLESLWF